MKISILRAYFAFISLPSRLNTSADYLAHYFLILKWMLGVSVVAQQKQIWLVSMRTQISSLASLSQLRIWCCHELWCKSQTWLGSGVDVGVVEASGYSFSSTPSLGASICCEHCPENSKNKWNWCSSPLLSYSELSMFLFLFFMVFLQTKNWIFVIICCRPFR